MKLVIDISEHNGNIDFKKLKTTGIKDVIIRIGWIGNKENHTLDKKFISYYNDAKNNGFNIGFYVYSYCKTYEALRSGTKWTYNQIKDKKFTLPIFIDLEDDTIKGIGKTNLTSHAKYFCDFMKEKGFKTGVYANLYWFNNLLDINKLLNYKIWLAQYTTANNHSFKYKVDLWQYTSKGKLNGINSNIDISKCLCDCNEEKERKEKFEMAKTYKNGSTIEVVYADSNLSHAIGTLNKYEVCECLGIVNQKYIVKYKVNNTNNYKVGFVKYSGGVK